MAINLDILPNIISDVRAKLFSMQNQDLLKLIYYDAKDTNNPYTESNLTPMQLINMVSPNNTSNEHPNERRIFYNSFTGEIEDTATTKIYMYIDNVTPENRGIAGLLVRFHIITHLNIVAIHSKNSTSSFPTQNRHEAILAEIIKILNEQHVGGVGKMQLATGVSYRHQVWRVGEKWIGGDLAMQIGST